MFFPNPGFYGHGFWLGLVSMLAVPLMIWDAGWKLWALWIAARKNQKIWFVALAIFNTVGILPILYIFFFSKKNCCGSCGLKKTFTAAEAKEVGEKLGIKWDKYDVEQFRMGMDVELEHGKVDQNTNVTNDDALLTGKIALAHLNEIQDYYTRLAEMEEEGEKYWENKK